HVADPAIAERRRARVPRHRVTARPVAVGLGAGLQRHADPVAGVVARTAYVGELPARAEVPGAPLGIGLEPARRQGHRARRDLEEALSVAAPDSTNGSAVIEPEPRRLRPVTHLDAETLGLVVERLDQPRAAAHRLHVEAAPEAVLAADVVRLAR